MLDNQLIKILIDSLKTGEAVAGIPGMPITQSFQPTQQGVNSGPTIFIYKIGPDKRYGSPQWKDIWILPVYLTTENGEILTTESGEPIITEDGYISHVETQQYESLFQISSLSPQNPKLAAQYTASDIANFCASILQSQVTIASLQTQNVGVERVQTVRNTYFLDDRQQYEVSANFDIVITHDQIITSTTPILQSEEFQLIPI